MVRRDASAAFGLLDPVCEQTNYPIRLLSAKSNRVALSLDPGPRAMNGETRASLSARPPR
jgi:hypothetical protein